MRKNLFIFIVLFGCTLCSCTEDNRTLHLADPNCCFCNGTGYVEISKYFGLKTIYNDCILCKQQLSSQQGNTDGNVSFRGNPSGKCNIPSHNCTGYVEGKIYLECAVCAKNHYRCHKSRHL